MYAGNIRPVPQIVSEPDPTSPESIAKALLSHVPKGEGQESELPHPLLPPGSKPEAQAQPIAEPDQRQCYQIVDGRLISVPLHMVLPKPKPKGAMKKGVAGDAAGT